MKRLIISADDLGVNVSRSHGIFQCVETGIVTNVSLLANGSDSVRAARIATERSIPTGLHLNLTEEYPLCAASQIPSLLEGSGAFMELHKLQAALAHDEIDAAHLEREIRAQMEWFLEHRGQPTHVDSRHHVHTHPSVARALMPSLERYGIRFVRIPCELPLPPWGYIVSEEMLTHTREQNTVATKARELYSAFGIGSTDHFRGTTLKGIASLKNLRHTINKIQDGTTELMVHPGNPIAYGTPFDLDPQRQTELRMLTDEGIAAHLAEKEVHLISYSDL